MNRFALILSLLVLGSLADAAVLRAAEVTCYNDDSLDVINQDELRLPNYPYPPAGVPAPDDCGDGPAVAVDSNDSLSPRVLVSGKVVYSNGRDPIVEARVAPTGAVAMLSQRGSLYRYNNGVTAPWFVAGARKVSAFRMSRDGGLIAMADDGALIVNGRAQNTIRTVAGLYASASGNLVALLSDGSVVDSSGVVYNQTTDGAREVKVARSGRVLIRTESGRVLASGNVVYGQTTDPVVAFKVNATGHVAYLTSEGRLGRDGQNLMSGVRRAVEFRINFDDSVTGHDSDGRAFSFR